MSVAPNGRKILIVEDEPHIAEAISFLCERDGIDADVVDNGAAALECVGRYDLVVLDIMLPGATGFAVAEAALAAPQPPKVCVLTAKGQPGDRARMSRIGVNAFITKPFSNRDLMATIHQLLTPT
ncbi:MAG: response regulator transcription factor [Pseudomonadota bacterium]